MSARPVWARAIGPFGAAALFGATSTFLALHVGVALALALAVLFAVGPRQSRR